MVGRDGADGKEKLSRKLMLAAMTSKGEVAGQHLKVLRFVRVDSRAQKLRRELQEQQISYRPESLL
jgi:hypothetical protein